MNFVNSFVLRGLIIVTYAIGFLLLIPHTPNSERKSCHGGFCSRANLFLFINSTAFSNEICSLLCSFMWSIDLNALYAKLASPTEKNAISSWYSLILGKASCVRPLVALLSDATMIDCCVAIIVITLIRTSPRNDCTYTSSRHPLSRRSRTQKSLRP